MAKDDITIYNPEMLHCSARLTNIKSHKMARYDCDIYSPMRTDKVTIENIGQVEFKSVPYTANPPVMDWSTMGTGANGKPFIKVKVSNHAQCTASGHAGKTWKYLTCFVPEDRRAK